MSEAELKELSELLNEFRNANRNGIFDRATDFDLLKVFTECAIIKSLGITVEEYYNQKGV